MQSINIYDQPLRTIPGIVIVLNMSQEAHSGRRYPDRKRHVRLERFGPYRAVFGHPGSRLSRPNILLRCNSVGSGDAFLQVGAMSAAVPQLGKGAAANIKQGDSYMVSFATLSSHRMFDIASKL